MAYPRNDKVLRQGKGMVEGAQVVMTTDDALILLMKAVIFEQKFRFKQMPVVDAAIKKISKDLGIKVGL